jgi:hypothetical protein
LVVCFCGFVLLIALLWQVADDAEDAKKSRVNIVVQHKLFDDGSLTLGQQCLSHAVAITDQAWEVSAARKEARIGNRVYRAIEKGGGSTNFNFINDRTPQGWPQPFSRVPAVTDPVAHEFKLDAPKTYYYLVEVSAYECARNRKPGAHRLHATPTGLMKLSFYSFP